MRGIFIFIFACLPWAWTPAQGADLTPDMDTPCGLPPSIPLTKAQVLADLTAPTGPMAKLPILQQRGGTCYANAAATFASALFEGGTQTPVRTCSPLEIAAIEKSRNYDSTNLDGGAQFCENIEELRERGGCCSIAELEDKVGDKLYDSIDEFDSSMKSLLGKERDKKSDSIKYLEKANKIYFDYFFHPEKLPSPAKEQMAEEKKIDEAFTREAIPLNKRRSEIEYSSSPDDQKELALITKRWEQIQKETSNSVERQSAIIKGYLANPKNYDSCGDCEDYQDYMRKANAKSDEQQKIISERINPEKKERSLEVLKALNDAENLVCTSGGQTLDDQLKALFKATDDIVFEPMLTLNARIKKSCAKTRSLAQSSALSKCDSLSKANSPKKFAQTIREHFIDRKEQTPIGLAFCAGIILSHSYEEASTLANDTNLMRSSYGLPENCGSHQVLMTGLRWGPQGKCQVKIRNSWGASCYGISSSLFNPSTTGWECKNGDLWVDSDVLLKATTEIEWVKKSK